MPDATQAISLVVAGVLGGVGLWWSRRSLRKAGVGVGVTTTITNLRDLAESWEARHELVTAELAAERTAHAATKAILEDEQRSGDRCRRQLDSALAELRGAGRRPPRTQRPGA